MSPKRDRIVKRIYQSAKTVTGAHEEHKPPPDIQTTSMIKVMKIVIWATNDIYKNIILHRTEGSIMYAP